MISFSSQTTGLGRLRVEVVLPSGYKRLRHPLPFVILCDAQNQWKDRGAYGGWHTDAIAAWLMKTRQLRPIALVGIHSPSHRDRAYAPPPWGHAGFLADHLADKLIPAAQRRFRLTSNRDEIGIIGASFAANFALEAALFRPDIFGLCGAFSAAPHAGENLVSMVAKRKILPMKRLYMDAGTKWAYDNPGEGDNSVFTRRIYELAKHRMPSRSVLGRICRGHYHNEEFWRKRIGRALVFLYGKP